MPNLSTDLICCSQSNHKQTRNKVLSSISEIQKPECQLQQPQQQKIYYFKSRKNFIILMIVLQRSSKFYENKKSQAMMCKNYDSNLITKIKQYLQNDLHFDVSLTHMDNENISKVLRYAIEEQDFNLKQYQKENIGSLKFWKEDILFKRADKQCLRLRRVYYLCNLDWLCLNNHQLPIVGRRFFNKTQLISEQCNLNSEILKQFFSDFKNLLSIMINFDLLIEKFEQINRKVLNIEQYLNELKERMTESTNLISKKCSVQFKKLLINQINKQILIHSFELEKEAYQERSQIIDGIETIKQKLNQITSKFGSKRLLIQICREVLEQLQIQRQLDRISQVYYEEKSRQVTNLLTFLTLFNTLKLENNQDFERYLNNENDEITNIDEQTSFRMKVAFAGVNKEVLSYCLAIQGKYNNDKKLFDQQNVRLIALSLVLGLAATKLPGIDLIVMGGIGIVQSFLNFSNPYRTLSADLREQYLSMSQLTATGGFGIAGALIGQAIIPVPFLGAVVGGLVMEFFGLFVSNQIKRWSKDSWQEKLIDTLVQSNVEVEESNLNIYYEAFGIKRETFQNKISLPEQYLVHKLTSTNGKQQQQQCNNNKTEIEMIQIYLLFVLQMLGQQIFEEQKKSLENDQMQNEYSELQSKMDAFTEAFDFNYLSIGKNLYLIFKQIKNLISAEDVISIVEPIEPEQINNNNPITIEVALIRYYCKESKLRKLFISKGIDDKLISDSCPKSIMNMDSDLKLDLWCTYICLQLINPSYVFSSIFMIKVNFQLETKNIFFIDAIETFHPIFKEMFTDL